MATKAISTYLPLPRGVVDPRKGAWNPLLGLYGIKEREESNIDPGENVSQSESGLYI